MFIVRIYQGDGTYRYRLVDLGDLGDTSMARSQVQGTLGEGEYADISVTADADGLKTMRRQSPDFATKYGNRPISEIVPLLRDWKEALPGVASAAAQPGEPLSAETGVAGTGVAFRRALEAIPGMAPFRGVGRDLQAPLTNIFDIGGLAGLKEGPFSGLGAFGREEFAVGDFFRNALDALQRGTSTIGGLASQAFNAPETFNTTRFLNPEFGMATGAEGDSAATRLRNAEQFAQLARLAAREQFGTVLSRRLAGPQQLVEQFRAQPIGSAEEDFRTFLESRTSR
jgi:hypothetical protein